MNLIITSKNFAAALTIVATMAFGVAGLHAQILGEVTAKVPFEFNVENTRLPAGDYIIAPTDDASVPVLEVTSADGKVGIFVTPLSTQVKQLPKISELVFDKIGNHYFLREIWVEASQLGYTFDKPRAEVKLEKTGLKSDRHRLTVKHSKTRTRKP